MKTSKEMADAVFRIRDARLLERRRRQIVLRRVSAAACVCGVLVTGGFYFSRFRAPLPSVPPAETTQTHSTAVTQTVTETALTETIVTTLHTTETHVTESHPVGTAQTSAAQTAASVTQTERAVQTESVRSSTAPVTASVQERTHPVSAAQTQTTATGCTAQTRSTQAAHAAEVTAAPVTTEAASETEAPSVTEASEPSVTQVPHTEPLTEPYNEPATEPSTMAATEPAGENETTRRALTGFISYMPRWSLSMEAVYSGELPPSPEVFTFYRSDSARFVQTVPPEKSDADGSCCYVFETADGSLRMTVIQSERERFCFRYEADGVPEPAEVNSHAAALVCMGRDTSPVTALYWDDGQYSFCITAQTRDAQALQELAESLVPAKS